MAINQLSVFLENKPGSLIEVTDVLGKAGIDIRAMSIADTRDFGILRLIVSDTQSAKDLLSGIGCVASITSVVGVAVSDQPGALTQITRILCENGTNIEYMYAFLTRRGSSAYVVLRVNNNGLAEKLLAERGVELLCEDDIKRL